MTQLKTRKPRVNFTAEQKLGYVELMVNEDYANKQIIKISDTVPTSVVIRKKCLLTELNSQTPKPVK